MALIISIILFSFFHLNGGYIGVGQKWELEANKKAYRGRVGLGIRLLDKSVNPCHCKRS
jgi:hypothetical protein